MSGEMRRKRIEQVLWNIPQEYKGVELILKIREKRQNPGLKSVRFGQLIAIKREKESMRR